MKQFNLSEWLANPSRKVVTRDGREVEILKTNRKDGVHPIIFTLIDPNGIEQVHLCNEQGVCTTLPRPNKFDLFFADEEEELTELQKTLEEDCDCYVNLYNDGKTRESLRAWIKAWSPRIIDLARKELLKDLLKWKKSTEHKDLEMHIAIFEDNKVLLSNYLEEGDYYIVLDDLKTLPKEE